MTSVPKVDYSVPRLSDPLSKRVGELLASRLVVNSGEEIMDIDYADYGFMPLSREIVSLLFQGIIEEDYLGQAGDSRLPEPPPEMTDPVISDLLHPVRDEEQWRFDDAAMEWLKKLYQQGSSTPLIREETQELRDLRVSRLRRLYELALAGWSCTFYRKD